MKKVLVLALLALGLIATPALAKEGVYFGAGLAYDNIIGSDVDNYKAGGGLNFKLGYSFGSVALEGDWFGTAHDGETGFTDADLSGLSINVKASFSEVSDPTQVYILAGFGGFLLEFKQATVSGIEELRGGGFNLGGGVEHFFNDQVSLNLAAIYRFIIYDEAEDQFGTLALDDWDGDTFSLNAGINVYF